MPSSLMPPAADRVAIVTGGRVMVVRMTTVASMFALLQGMIECPTCRNRMARVARCGIAARGMGGRSLRQMATQTTSCGHSGMIVDGRRPCRGVMTAVATQRRFRSAMTRRSGRGRHTVVASRASTACNAVMAVPGGSPSARAVALVAHQRGLHPGVIRRPAGRGNTVMTTRTTAIGHRGVVVKSGIPGSETVTGIAGRCRLQHGSMRGRLARGQRTVVALDRTATGRNCRVIKT